MKKCPYCGNQYADGARICAIDGEPLVASGAPTKRIYEVADAPAPDSSLSPTNDPVEREASANVQSGALLLIAGIVVTGLTYSFAANNPGGGTYFIAWGAIVVGSFRLIRGLSESGNATLRVASQQDDSSDPKPWVCAHCGEAMDSQFDTCLICQTGSDDEVLEQQQPFIGTKRVYTSPSSAEVGYRRGLLESAGIRCEMRQEAISQTMVGIQFGPEIWVSDEDYEEARQLIA